MSKNILGVQLYSVRQFVGSIKDLDASLRKIADIGYKAVEFFPFGSASPSEFAHLVKDHGLVVAGTHTPWNRFLNDLDNVIAEHKQWNCQNAGVSWLPARYYEPNGIKKFLDDLAPISKKLVQEDITFYYHNHGHELMRIEGKTWLETLYDKASMSLIKAELDVYWIQAGGGDPASWIRKYPNRQPLLHLKDMTVGGPWWRQEQQTVEVGEGNLNWPAILQAAKESGVQWYIIEQDVSYRSDPFASLRISYDNLQKMGL